MGDEGSLRVWLFIYQGWASLALPDLVCPCTTLLTAAFGDCSELLTTGEKPNKYKALILPIISAKRSVLSTILLFVYKFAKYKTGPFG